jgi:hypothetical protein
MAITHPGEIPTQAPRNKEKAGPLAKILTFGAIGAAAIAGGAVEAHNFSVADQKEAQGNALDVGGAVPNTGNEAIDTTMPDLYSDISSEKPSVQLNSILPFLEQRRDATAQEWKNQFSAAFQLEDPGQFSGKMAEAQRILNTISLDTRTASDQTNPTLAHNLVGGPYAPGSATYNRLTGHEGYTAQIQDGQPISDRRLVDSVSDSFTQGTIGNFSANGRETLVINTTDMNDTSKPAWELVVSKVTSADGQHTTEQVQKMMEYGDSDFITGLDTWHPQQ